MDGEKGNKAFAQSLDVDYPILSDATKGTAQAFGVLSEKGFANRWTFYIGKDGKILHVDRAVKAGQHGTDVVGKLKELGVAEKK